MKKVIIFSMLVASLFVISSCHSRYVIPDGEVNSNEKIEYLKTRCKDDSQLVARLLAMRYTQIDSILSNKLKVTDKEEYRIDEVYSYATSQKASLTKMGITISKIILT